MFIISASWWNIILPLLWLVTSLIRSTRTRQQGSKHAHFVVWKQQPSSLCITPICRRDKLIIRPSSVFPGSLWSSSLVKDISTFNCQIHCGVQPRKNFLILHYFCLALSVQPFLIDTLFFIHPTLVTRFTSEPPRSLMVLLDHGYGPFRFRDFSTVGSPRMCA